MNFLIVGPGAMGCLFSARLKKAGHTVTLLDYVSERADLINKNGIAVEGITGEYNVNVPVTVEEALAYLQDQGNPVDDQDLLKMHINAVAGMVVRITNRPRLFWVDDDAISELKTIPENTNIFFTSAAPIRKITSVVIYPHDSTGTTYTGPSEPTTYTDDFYFDPAKGYVIYKPGNWPSGPSSVQINYEAGFFKPGTDNEGNATLGDPEYHTLKMVALDALGAKWARYRNKKHGVSSETRGEQSIVYSVDDFSKTAMKELRTFRRSLFV